MSKQDHRGFEASATPVHFSWIEGYVLDADPAIFVGERCRWPRPSDEAGPARIGSFDPGLTYYAASVTPNGERRASDWLERAGFKPFVPSRIVERRHAGRKTLVRRPVFPGYSFVGKTKAQSWHSILREPGVVSLVSAGTVPIVLPPWQMRMLAAADEFDAYEAPKSHGEFEQGQKVKILGAMWAGLIGEVMRAPESRRIAVLLDARGQKIKFEVDVDMLRAA